ncbi:MAG TPA: glycosyltransferase family 4 protein [Rhodanobacteraceae bacterium]|nr:glycosyltransferase family 4 protein [Rhodanobacteraceae bacterium]
MRLTFLCKRHPQQRDLLERPYGRFHHLPAGLAALGHQVRVQLCSYRNLPSGCIERNGVLWSSHDVRGLGVGGLMKALDAETAVFRPDWIIACSDAWYGVIGRRLAKHHRARLAIDAYDNFEAYMPWNLPLHWAWRRALRTAELVTAAGPQLAQLLQSHRHGEAPAEVLPMAADPEFVPMDKLESRGILGLPETAPLIGYVGSWARNRGTDMLLDAFRRARAAKPNLQLVLSGRPPAHALAEPGVTGLGYIPDARLPVLLNALDVVCTVTADTRFGRYSYPAKLCEAMACGVPVVATATEPVRWMLRDLDRHLVPVNDPVAFAERVLDMLARPEAGYGERPGWREVAGRLDRLLQLQTDNR